MHLDIINQAGERLDHSFEPGREPARRPGILVLLGHGVTGNKDRPVLVDTARALNGAGFDTLRFSFSGNGDSGGRFVDSTITKEVSDLDAVLEAASKRYPQIVYIGHSMGAAVGVIKAAEDRRINALVSLAGMVDTEAFARTEFGEPDNPPPCMWNEPDCPLSKAFMKDLCETIGTVMPQVSEVSVPWLLVHGSADDVVLPGDSEGVKAARGDAVTLVSVEGADHSFSEPKQKAEQVRAVVDWLKARFPQVKS
jgi:alpha/beta superfamily hydrolase